MKPSPHRLLPPFLLCLHLASLSGCKSKPPEKTGPDHSATKTKGAAAKAAGKLRLIEAPPKVESVPELVTMSMRLSKAKGRRVLVYVGAPWCEPCGHFKKAAKKGELDQAFPNVTLLVFNLDKHRKPLKDAGYGSKLIPLFVVPDEKGRGTDKRIFGSVKGPGAVANITPRLKALLSK